jgi:two-component system, NtrC family, sensor kinase
MPSNAEWRIVIIDDEPDIREVIGISLSDAGYVIETAVDGVDGIERCRAFDPHIVLTDIRMPRMDGIQVLSHLKERHPHIEVIVATAFGEMALAIQSLQLDASDFITKPIDHGALMVALDRAKERVVSRKKLQDYTRFLEEGWTEATEELLATFTYQQKLIESSMDGILGCDDQECVITFNRSLERMLGYARGEVRHQMSLGQFFDPDQLARIKTALGAETFGGPNQLTLLETRMRSKNGTLIPVQLSATLLMEQGRSEGLVCFIRDLRQIRRLEQQMSDQARILHQDKMMSLGRLAASVAHEINNPLSGVLNYVRLMLRILSGGTAGREQTEKFQRYLDTVEKEVDRCARIVSSLLTFARKSPAHFAPVDIAELLARSVVLSRHRLELGNIALTTDIAPDLPRVNGDANQLQQCLINLIFNAIDAMPEGGKLMLRAAMGNSGRSVAIKVQDSGSGIADEHRPHIFEPFFTTKQEGQGTGLGLSTSYGIIERHHGTIAVDSTPGHGATFTINLPAAQ